MDIEFSEENGRGRWSACPEGASEEAELTFSRTNDELIMVDHTFVPPTVRDEGIGAALAKRAYKDAKANGWKIAPVCPFFKAIAEKKGWKDVVQL